MDTFEKFGMRHYSREEIEAEEAKMVRRYAIGVPLSILFLTAAACATVYFVVDLASPKADHTASGIDAPSGIQNHYDTDTKSPTRTP